MIVRPNKILSIKKHFIEFTMDDDIEAGEETIPDFGVFKSLNSAEQYYLAENYNWDDGTVVLDWIIDSPECDKGTACLIFWRAEPDFYFNYTEDTIADYEKDVWLLLQKILMRFRENNFKSRKLRFIPSEEGYKTDWPIELDIWSLPTDLIHGIDGKKPFTFGL